MSDARRNETHAVTGAYGYSGRYIAKLLTDCGARVITLTNTRPPSDIFDGKVTAFPLKFDEPDTLISALRGVRVLHNTYWVRFNHRGFTFDEAVRNTRILFAAAKEAGVERVVHVSITNPSEDSPLEYFRGKAQLETALVRSGMSHAILRPTVLFGAEDILINNIAWMLRRFPVFGLFGRGEYRLQPVFVGDLAELAVRYSRGLENVVVQAIGPETFTYRELVSTIGRIIGRSRPLVALPPGLGYCAGRVLGAVLRDVVITRDEIRALMEERLYVDAPPAGTTSLTDWATQHKATLGARYASELARRRGKSFAVPPDA